MEVHHHPHTETTHAGKRFKHYLFEFFMLFLAVFCGFLAENWREYFIEHQREKQFMRSLAEDLETDTAELHRAMGKADTVALYSDSLIKFLVTYKISKQVPIRLADLTGIAGQRQVLINTDRTSSQLKNSGAMRLIRNEKVTNLIIRYWKQIDESNITLDRYILYRNAGRELAFKLWTIPEVYQSGLSMKPDSIRQLKLIDGDPKKWDEFANLIAISGRISKPAHYRNLQQQLALATELITLIKNEYHLK